MARDISPGHVAKRVRGAGIILILPVLILVLSAVLPPGGAQGTDGPVVITARAEAATQTLTLAAAGPPLIKHDLAGREKCLVCHNPEGKVNPAPKSHIGRKVETCRSCHKKD